MFRNPLRSLVRLLIPFSCVAGAALPAFAADVNDVLFIVTVARSSEVDDEITAELRVQGTDLTNGSITFPPASTLNPKTLVLQDDGDDLARGLDFSSEAELAAVFPSGNYQLSTNNGTVTATIAYARPAVPSPDIEFPDAGDVVPSGPVEVLFTACPVCNLTDDSVVGLLTDAALTELANDTLTESDEAWIPSDGIGGDFLLPEGGEFRARITHTAVRQDNFAVSGEENEADDQLLFTDTFVRSDEVGFQTGFNPPAGDFCVVVNDPTPPVGCSPLDDPLLSLLDTSGTVVTTVAGLDVEYTFTVGPKGELTGNGTADLDDNGSLETVGAIKGKLKGKAGELKQKLSFPLENEGLLAKLKVSVSDVLSIPEDSLARTQKASGNLGEEKVKEETTSNGALPVAPQGWQVNFTITAEGAVEAATLTLEGGRNFDLVATQKYNFAKNLSTLKLETADKGIKIQLKKVELDDEVVPTAVVGGDLGYKILGQSGKATLP